MSDTTADLWQAADARFDELLDLPPAERRRRIEEIADPALRELVARLVAAEEAHDPLLDGAPPSAGLSGTGDETGLVGRRIGAFRAVTELGRGGMAVVYLAHRVDGSFEQEVAIKVLRRSAATRDLLGRFRRERQILAASDHPGMARIFDGGETEDGRPYLVMERVQGERIDEHCDRRSLGVRERLRLFLEVAHTVADAHRRLVVHRDIKPSNILVTADGRPKLLDFGIAKLLEGSEHDQTKTHHRLMTPAYAAPEQILGEEVTTATDVYQLGVLLYELLTGRLPHAVEGAPAEVARRIAHDAPPPPSERVDETTAAARGCDTAGELRRALRGDLDAILLRALAKAPEARYGAVGALTDDLERHLEDRPVRARSDSLAYRATSHLRRHRGFVASAGLLALLLLAYGLSVSWQARRLQAERDRANRAAASAEAVAGFLTGLFLDSDPTVGRRGDLTAEELLERGVARLAAGDIADPLIAARLRATIGEVYAHLARDREAAELLRQAVAVLEAELGPLADETLRARQRLLAAVHYSGDVDGAERLARELLAALEEKLGADDPQAIAARNRLGEILAARGALAEAETLHRRSLELARRREGPRGRFALSTQNHLASVLVDQGRLREAEALYRDTAAGYGELLGEDHPALLMIENVLAIIARRQGRIEEAAAGHLRVHRRFREVIGPEHPSTYGVLSALAAVELARGDGERARELTAEAVAGIRRAKGDEHPMTLSAQVRAAEALAASGRAAEAVALSRQTVDAYRRTLGPRSPYTLAAERHLLRLRRHEGEDTAEGYRELVERATAVLGPEHTTLAQILYDAGCQAFAAGDRSTADALLRRAAAGATVLELADPELPRLAADRELAAVLAAIEERRRAEGLNDRAGA